MICQVESNRSFHSSTLECIFQSTNVAYLDYVACNQSCLKLDFSEENKVTLEPSITQLNAGAECVLLTNAFWRYQQAGMSGIYCLTDDQADCWISP